MNDPRGRFHPSELDLEQGPESAELLATARDLEAYAASGLASPTVGFEDRVMAAVATEPMPRRAGRGFLATVRDAWAIAFGAGRPMAHRVQAFAMLFALALAIGSVGSVAVIGATRLLGDQGPLPPTVPSPSPNPSPSPTPVSPSPSPSVAPSPTPTPSPRTSPTETAEPSGTDDHGGSGSGSGSGNSGSGSGSDDAASDDSGGSSGSGRSGSSGSDDSGSEPTDDHSGSGSSSADTSETVSPED